MLQLPNRNPITILFFTSNHVPRNDKISKFTTAKYLKDISNIVINMKILTKNLKSDLKQQLKQINLICEHCNHIKSPTLEADLIPNENGDLVLVVIVQKDFPLICLECKEN